MASASNGVAMQMNTKGMQDKLTFMDPHLSLWRRNYRRIANFALEDLAIDMPTVRWGREVIGTIPRCGDLVREVHLQVDINPVRLLDDNNGVDTVNFTNVLGHCLFDRVDYRLGHIVAETIYGQMMEIMHEYQCKDFKKSDNLVMRAENKEQLIDWSKSGNMIDEEGNPIIRLFIRLPFFFSHANSLALPLVALQFSNSSVAVNLRDKASLLQFSNPANTELDPRFNGEIRKMDIIPQIIFVEPKERKVIINTPSDYLIQRADRSTFHTKNEGLRRLTVNLGFSHPMKFLTWIVQRDDAVQAKNYFDYSLTDGHGDDPIVAASLQINRALRERRQGAFYWRQIQPERYFSHPPGRPQYCYSFAMWAGSDNVHPSGTLNGSRLESLDLILEFPSTDANGKPYKAATVTAYTLAFNVFTCKAGVGSIRFAS